MIVFLDFEASSLAKKSYPIEIAWVCEDGTEESHLIRPAPDWTDWSVEAEGLHGLSRDQLLAEGTPHDIVARRMVESLTGHDLYATAPSWDGRWLSLLLRKGGQPRHALRLRDTEVVQAAAIDAAMRDAGTPSDRLKATRVAVLKAARAEVEQPGPPVHRALPDARQELRLFQAVKRLANVAARRS